MSSAIPAASAEPSAGLAERSPVPYTGFSQAELHQNTIVIHGVRGEGGIGKTILAATAFGNEEVKAHFGEDERYWLTFSQQPNILQLQADLICDLKRKNATDDELPAASAEFLAVLAAFARHTR